MSSFALSSVVPSGRFTMGLARPNEPGREPGDVTHNRGEDQLAVTIGKPFAVGRFAVTRGDFAAFVAATTLKTDGGFWAYSGSEWELRPERNWRSPGFTQDDTHPVVCVNWHDAKAYVAWLSSTTGKQALPAVVGGRARIRRACGQHNAMGIDWGLYKAMSWTGPRIAGTQATLATHAAIAPPTSPAHASCSALPRASLSMKSRRPLPPMSRASCPAHASAVTAG